MSNFGYPKDEDIDEDELLSSLTGEELQELEKIMAIESDEISAGLRQDDQTSRRATGTFSRDALLKYWENESNRSIEIKCNLSLCSCFCHSYASAQHCFSCFDDTQDSVDEGQTDKDEACGTEEPVDNEDKRQQHDRGHKQRGEAKSSNQNITDVSDHNSNIDKSGWKPNGKRVLHHTDSNLTVTPERQSDIDKILEKILSNDSSLTSVNLNNIENISQAVFVSFANALISNTHVEVFSLANTHADDQVAIALAKMLERNRRITNLNVESNFISGKGILALIGSLQHNTTLLELRFHNQRHICGGQVEMEMAKLLGENTTLLKLGYQFDLPGPRMSATGILTRNQDRQRQRRLEQRRQRDNLESTS
ncbi:leiomodin-2a [Paramisgurnus dabryanus]|uniref:leiomodin-2a n=1 Tax=Paramisgurnus dabryanus TaxID=90735 RepID=UPI0031F3E49F